MFVGLATRTTVLFCSMTTLHLYDICMTSASSEIQMPHYHGSKRQADFFQAQVEITLGQTRVDRKVGGKVKQVNRRGIGYL